MRQSDSGLDPSAITVSGDGIVRSGQSWWLAGFNSFAWSGDCGHDYERMSSEDVDAWFASMRHDGHGAVRLFFFEGWSLGRLDAAVVSARRHNVYLTVTLANGIDGCGDGEKGAGWFGNAQARAEYEAHLTTLVERYRGDTTIAWFEYLNEPQYAGGRLRQFYDEMGARAKAIDPQRLFSSGTIAPYSLGADGDFLDVRALRRASTSSPCTSTTRTTGSRITVRRSAPTRRASRLPSESSESGRPIKPRAASTSPTAPNESLRS